jgi:hypothetical protein
VFVKCRHSILIKELILKPYTKFEFKSNKQTRRRKRGESLPGKPGGTGFAKLVAPVWAVCLFRCAGASSKILDFPETPGKSPEYPGFTNKIVLSGDFQDSPIHAPSRRHQDPFTTLLYSLLHNTTSSTAPKPSSLQILKTLAG